MQLMRLSLINIRLDTLAKQKFQVGSFIAVLSFVH